MNELPETVREKLDALASAPGVYVFKDRDGLFLYVGKAASLKSRVRSYFQPRTSDQRYFIERLQWEIADIETFVAQSEKEAALLENSLIKEHKPRYNVKLRDDKEFLSLRLDPDARWPRLEVVRRAKRDGAHYFGPYHSASSARSTLRVVNRHFRLRTCTDSELTGRARPCLQYQIKRCPGPCVHEVDAEEYGAQVRGVSLFLDGRHDELVQHLQRSMGDAAGGLRYELAAVYRDQLRAVQSTQQEQRVSEVSTVDQDVFGYFRTDDKVELAVLLARRGRVVGLRTFDLRDVRLPDDELIAQFVGEYYGRSSYVPHEVLLPLAIEAALGLEQLLAEQRGSGVKVLWPQRGKKAHLLRMAQQNAAHAYREKARAREDVETKLQTIQQKLALPRLPERIECVDISHIGGEHTVAVIVAFERGVPDKKRYRSYRVRDVAAGDDYAAIHHVLTRRLTRVQRGDVGWEPPDLLLIDGGKGQLAMAERALQELGVENVPIAALAKEKQNALGEQMVDRVYLPGRKNAIELREGGSALQILAYARDEAHRASNALRVKVGKKRGFESELDAIEGVGRKTRAILLKAFGSVKAIAGASAAAIVAAGATRKQADAIAAHFRSGAEETEASEELAVEHAFGEVVAELDPESDPAPESEPDAEPEPDSEPDTESEPDAFAGRQLN